MERTERQTFSKLEIVRYMIHLHHTDAEHEDFKKKKKDFSERSNKEQLEKRLIAFLDGPSCYTLFNTSKEAENFAKKELIAGQYEIYPVILSYDLKDIRIEFNNIRRFYKKKRKDRV